MQSKPRKYRVLYGLLATLLVIIVVAGCFALWLSAHYKGIIRSKVPEMVARSSDGVYRAELGDISINLYRHSMTLTGLRITPDSNRRNQLKKDHQHAPASLSTVYIPELEVTGLDWDAVASGKTLSCSNVMVHHIKWRLETIKRANDEQIPSDKRSKAMVTRLMASHIDFDQPDITFYYSGPHNSYTAYVKGGTARLNDFVYDRDTTRDTSVFLYAKSGVVRMDSFIFRKGNHDHYVKKPTIDFNCDAHCVHLTNVTMKPLIDYDREHAHEVITYDFRFPQVDVYDFNWLKLINDNLLAATKMVAVKPHIAAKYIRDYGPNSSRLGKYPHQLLQQAINTNIREFSITDGYLQYTEPVTKKNTEAVIQFHSIAARFTNICNIDSIIAVQKTCNAHITTRYMNKSPLTVDFELSLTDPKGHFDIQGKLRNLDGEQVTKQAEAFTLAKVTSFQLSEMDMQLDGDETYANGKFTMLYEGLKLSLLKFKTDERKTPNGPLAFLADALILYPSNPMPGKEVRKVTTSFVRNPEDGFIALIWKNIYRGAKKTAVRSDKFIDATDGPETGSGAKKHKPNFLQRLFSKHK